MTENQQYDMLRHWGYRPLAVLRRGGPPTVARMAEWLSRARDADVQLLREETTRCNACGGAMRYLPATAWVCPYCTGKIPAWVAPEASAREEEPG